MTDELRYVRDARPLVEGPSDRVVQTARSELMNHVQNTTEHLTETTDRPSRRRWAVLLVVVSVFVTAAAGWAITAQGGNLEEPAFSGESWQLTVGEASNGDGTYKVCRAFFPTEEPATDGNGLGGGGCEISPVEAPGGTFISDVQAAIRTPTGVVVLVDLTKQPVASVRVAATEGEAAEVTPFVMPDSEEQFVAVEVPATTSAVTVTALDAEGNELDSRVVSDLTVR